MKLKFYFFFLTLILLRIGHVESSRLDELKEAQSNNQHLMEESMQKANLQIGELEDKLLGAKYSLIYEK